MVQTVFMFSGQGSQYFQMGRELFDRHPGFARHMRAMDEMVRERLGMSVLDALYGARPRSEPFDDLLLTHPAIFMVEQALTRVLAEAGIEPDITLGASLGFAAASVAAGMFDTEQALDRVLAHARWVVRHAQEGGMIGVLAGPEAHLAAPLRQHSVIAAYNGASHIVLSARHDRLAGIEAHLRDSGIAFGRLPVRYAFHSPWLLPEGPQGDAVPAPPHWPGSAKGWIPVACCASVAMLAQVPPDHFIQVASRPIDFQATVGMLEARGPCRYVDLSPSSTLATLMKYLLPAQSPSQVVRLLNPYGRDLAGLEALGVRVA